MEHQNEETKKEVKEKSNDIFDFEEAVQEWDSLMEENAWW